MTIREYLAGQARQITERPRPEFTDKPAYHRQLAQRRREYAEMMGLADHLPHPPRASVNVHVTGVVERPNYRIEKLYYESLPKLYVTANLYVPKTAGAPPGQAARFPGVIYVCGHSDTQKVHYQAHPRRFAELGFACLIVETVQLGEVRGYHHGLYREGWHHWISRGYSPAGIEAINGIRGLDLLAQRPDVDPARLGVTGISGGGAVTWWIAAADERVKAAAPVCGTSTLASYIADRTIDGHCDCMWPSNTYRWDLADVGALIAPRPLLIVSADRDPLFTIASIRHVHEQLKPLYSTLGAADNLRLIETPGGHSYHERSRTGIFSWFAKHLQGRDIAPGKVGDIDDSPKATDSADTLRVFAHGPLLEDRTPTIQDDLFTPPALPNIETVEGLRKTRAGVVAALRKQTFGAFPSDPPALNPVVEYDSEDNGAAGCRFAFTSEAGWRLHGRLTRPKGAPSPSPAVVVLRGPDEERDAAEKLLGQIRAPWIKAIVETRGTGDTAWGQELQWHLRRAAFWTGRTLASMRVWDTLRAIEAVRALPGVDKGQIALAARGEMAAVALYAALLDGRVHTLLLESPPATQNAGGRPDGRGPAIEMLNCLRITDLPQVAGLLFPAEIVLAGDRPAAYTWAEDLYRKLGAPGKFHHAADLSMWRPAANP